MNKDFNDIQLKRKYGMRPDGTPIDFPQEIGYRCPSGHSSLQWSEFNKHIWCDKCKMDFFYADCFLIKDSCNPTNLPIQPRTISEIQNWAKDGNSFIEIPKKYINKNK